MCICFQTSAILDPIEPGETVILVNGITINEKRVQQGFCSFGRGIQELMELLHFMSLQSKLSK